MRLSTAMKFLKKAYEKSILDNRINKPVSWALYQTWKWADAYEKATSLMESIHIIEQQESIKSKVIKETGVALLSAKDKSFYFEHENKKYKIEVSELKEKAKKTNFEKIKQMDLEQLANYFIKMSRCNQCFLYPKCFECSDSGCKKTFKQWLEDEVEE